MKRLTMPECHAKLLELGKLFHSICVRHSIPYYMLYGTMLGAVRHNGFIPWDDDIDVGVPRKYYDKLLAILEKEIKEPYRVLTSKNANYPLCFIKIEDTTTVINDPQRKGKNNLSVGLNLDVFPLDECSIETERITPFIKKKERDIKLVTALYLSFVHNSIYKIIGRLFVKAIYCNKDVEYWIDRDKRLTESLSTTGNTAYINLSGIIYGDKELFSKDFFGKPTLYNFENTQFYGVEHPDLMLRQLYGDYMVIPPQNERHVHSSEIFIK